MNLRNLQCFQAAAELLNFSRAAEQLHMSQQSLSENIQHLEKMYNVKLFERTPRMRLTLAGERLLLHANMLLTDERRMEAELSDISKEHAQRLAVGIPENRAITFIPPIYARFHKRFPHIFLSMTEQKSEQMAPLLLNGKIDLYMGVNVNTNELAGNIFLTREKLFCLVRRSLLESAYPDSWEAILLSFSQGINTENLSYLIRLPMVVMKEGNRIRMLQDMVFKAHRLIPVHAFETNSLLLAFEMAVAGYGFCFTTQFLYYENYPRIQSDPNLFVFPVEIRGMDLSVYIVTLREDARPGYVTAFIEITKEVFREYAENIRQRKANHLLNVF